jgi:hypothetical protein
MIRRRPVMRAAVGTAVVAGTAAAVGGRVRHGQNERWQEQAEAQAYEQQVAQQPMAAAPPAPAPAAEVATSFGAGVSELVTSWNELSREAQGLCN